MSDRSPATLPIPLVVDRVREDFPILSREKYGKPLRYLDNAASTQKPRAVLDAIEHLYAHSYANIHRGVHFLSEEATAAYEAARGRVARFLGARSPAEVIFTRNATEGINLVAASFLRPRARAGRSIVLTQMEHHANIVPWQLLAEEHGLRVRPVAVTAEGEVDREDFRAALTEDPAFVALCHVSNTLGTINPVEEMVAEAKERDLPVLLDGAQAVAHFPVEVGSLGCDFYVFSGHKVFGPTGIGVLWGREELLAAMPPYQGGGDMIERVSFRGTTYAPPPARFEAGTPHIAGAVGLAAALDYTETLGHGPIEAHEQALLGKGTEVLRSVEGLRIVGEASRKVAVLSFVIEGVHPHDLATVLDRDGIAVRAGHHCTQPLLEYYGLNATTRASFAFYNTFEEVEALGESLGRALRILR